METDSKRFIAGKQVKELLQEFKDMDLDPDFASYLLMAAGMTLALQNNVNNASQLFQLIETSMMCARDSLSEEEKETCH